MSPLTGEGRAELPGAVRIGTVGGDSLLGVSVAALKAENERFFKEWMEG